MDRLSDKSSSLVLDQGRDSTISPMTGQPSDKSSSPGQGWDSTLSRMIGQLSGQSTSLDQGWDSTLSRMIGRLSNQSTSVSQRLDQSSQWLDEVQDESRVMRPLVGELDESAAQWSGSSGNRVNEYGLNITVCWLVLLHVLFQCVRAHFLLMLY